MIDDQVHMEFVPSGTNIAVVNVSLKKIPGKKCSLGMISAEEKSTSAQFHYTQILLVIYIRHNHITADASKQSAFNVHAYVCLSPRRKKINYERNPSQD